MVGKSLLELPTTLSAQGSVFFCFMRCRSCTRADQRRYLFFCFKCLYLERLAGREDMREESGVEKKLGLLMNRANETKIADSCHLGWLPQLLFSLLPLLPLTHRYVPLVTRISKRKGIGKIVFTCY